MKKLMILMMGLVMTAAVTADAKKTKKASTLSIGVAGAVGHSWVRGLPKNDHRDFKLSPALGIGLTYSHSEHWGYNTQLLISHEGYQGDVSDGNGGIQNMGVNPVYLRMPMNITYFFGKYGNAVRPKIYAGPSLGLKLDEKRYYSEKEPSPGEGTMSNTDMFRTFDIGINAGIGANVRLARKTWFNIDAGYYHGLLDAVQNDANKDFNGNRNVRLNFGVMWGL